jgi:FemAB-related protein (PEP-CTERM system-associated)
MIVREIRRGEEDRWDEFVSSCQTSTPQHLYAWKQVMEETLNSETHYLLAEEKGNITGVLPLIHVKSLITGHYITSLPGGLCTEDVETAGTLLEHAKEFVRATNARYLILRDGHKKWEFPYLVTDEEHVTFLIDVSPNLDQIKRTMKKRSRQLVNQASNNGLKATLGLDNLSVYYPIYARAMQEIGTPTLGLGFFKSVATHLPTRTNLIIVNHDDKIAGGGFISPFKQTVTCLWSGLLRNYYELQISHLLYWETIKYSHLNGYQYLDLGRCRKNSGGFEFKKGFGGQVQQLYQQFYLNGIAQTPIVGAEMKENYKYRIFVAIWRKLPQLMTEVLGPKLRKQMPFG